MRMAHVPGQRNTRHVCELQDGSVQSVTHRWQLESSVTKAQTLSVASAEGLAHAFKSRDKPVQWLVYRLEYQGMLSSIPGRCKMNSCANRFSNPSCFLYSRYWTLFLKEQSGRGSKLISQLHIMLTLNLHRDIPLLLHMTSKQSCLCA
jgi:hypothetical protein